MNKYLKKLGALFVVIALVFSLTSCDFASGIDNFMNSIFNSGNHEKKTEKPVIMPEDGELTIHFLDVGQGDAVLLNSAEGTILVDTGYIDSDVTNSIITYMQSLDITKIDYLVLTHPDADHIGGAPQILEAFEVAKVIMPDCVKTTKIYERTLDAIEKEDAEVFAAKAGQTYELGVLQMRLLAPGSDRYEDWNDYSVAMRVIYGKTAILLTGDAEKTSEKEMLENYSAAEFRADLMKAGHHGSRTSNSMALLEAADPDYFVISCGLNNSYGHPHAEVIERVRSLNIPVYRTDLDGTIVFVSDGETLFKVDNNID